MSFERKQQPLISINGILKNIVPDTIGWLLLKSLWNWSRGSASRHYHISRIAFNLWYNNKKRRCKAVRGNMQIPSVLAISPTMKCNYNCRGCYSRDRLNNNELTTSELDNLLYEAEELKIGVIVVTGGEPLMRKDFLGIVSRHKKLLFVMVTNGTLINSEVALKIKKCGNMVILVSIEGSIEDTDFRRGTGSYETVIKAFAYLHQAGCFFGFAATYTMMNNRLLGSDDFINLMISKGCSIGLLTEYVPCGPDPVFDWVVDEKTRAEFRDRVLHLRHRLFLIQFPHDEYGAHNRCTAAGRASLHINSCGDVEPCPFVPLSSDNIRRGGLMGAVNSEFMAAIRSKPHLMTRRKMACSLFENMAELSEMCSLYFEKKKRRDDCE